MRRLSASIIMLAALAGPAWAEPPTSDILQTLDQVMIERSAAAKCAVPDGAKAAAFRLYYQTITADAETVLKSLASDLDQSHIEKVMLQHYDEIDRRVAAVVAQESCDGMHIKEALQKYDSIATAVMAERMVKKNE
jgi:hypothetical protein